MADEATTPEKKPKPRKAPQRRSYSTELANVEAAQADLRARVDMAVILLRKAVTMDPAPAKTIMETAIETLAGE